MGITSMRSTSGVGAAAIVSAAMISAALLITFAGCSSGPGGERRSGNRLTPADFGGGGTARRVEGAPPPVPATQRPVAEARSGDDANGGIADLNAPGRAASSPSYTLTGPLAASGGIGDVIAVPGPPTGSAVPAAPVGDAVLVDAKIGDVNGRPIYASTFLEPMADRLRARAAERGVTRAAWREFASAEIARELEAFIEDELLRAEALAELTPEQKQGFFAFMQQLSENKIRENRGSREIADRALEQTDGQNVDQWLKSQEQRELIRYQLGQKIYRRVNISWRDITQAYERNYETFNPTPKAAFRLIQVGADAPADAAEVTRLLAAGTPFAEVAALPLNRFKRDEGGLETIEFTGERAQGQFFGNPKLNEAARTIEPEGVAGPIALTSGTAWLRLEAVAAPKMPLYQAQLNIENVLRERRSREERRKYIDRLRSRSSVTSTREMASRLLVIAEERYLPGADAAR